MDRAVVGMKIDPVDVIGGPSWEKLMNDRLG